MNRGGSRLGLARPSDALVAAEARLRAIKESGDLSLALGPGADRELRQLNLEPGSDLRAVFALGWLHWHRHERLALPGGGPSEDGHRAYAVFLRCFIRGMEPIPDRLVPDLAIGSASRATVLLDRAMAAHDADAIMVAAALWRRIQAAVPVSAAEWPRVMMMLCVALQGSFGVTGDVADLDAAVDAGRRGIAAVPANDPGLGQLLVSFASALRMRSSVIGTRQHADEAVEMLRQAVTVTPEGDSERPRMLSSLGAALRARFAAYQATADLTEAIAVARRAIAAARAGHKPELG
jgi:hypothetical protein